MDRPPPDPSKLLEAWMEWERGELPPGRVMANLKTGGLRDLLEALVAAIPAEPATDAATAATAATATDAATGASAAERTEVDDAAGQPATESWTPVV